MLISISQQRRKSGLLSFMSKFNRMVRFYIFKIFKIKNLAQFSVKVAVYTFRAKSLRFLQHCRARKVMA